MIQITKEEYDALKRCRTALASVMESPPSADGKLRGKLATVKRLQTESGYDYSISIANLTALIAYNAAKGAEK